MKAQPEVLLALNAVLVVCSFIVRGLTKKMLPGKIGKPLEMSRPPFVTIQDMIAPQIDCIALLCWCLQR